MRCVDLTHPLVDGQPAFPSDPACVIRPHATVAQGGYAVTALSFGSHQGTHLDAMSHFMAGGRTLDRMPLEWFFGPVSVLRIPRGPGETIGVADLAPFEGLLGAEAKVLLHTGWSGRFGEPEYFDAFPSLTLDAAGYLAERRIRLLGLDTPSPSPDYEATHHVLLRAEVVIVENLSNLDSVPDAFTLACFPLALVGGDGSPVRAVAIIS